MVKQHIVSRIKDDLKLMWGDMADHMVNRGLEDLGLIKEPSLDDMEKVIELLDTRTFPLFLKQDVANRKTRLYSRWLREEREINGGKLAHGVIIKFIS